MREIRSSSTRLTSESAPKPMSLVAATHCVIQGGEEAFCCREDDRCMPKLSNQHL